MDINSFPITSTKHLTATRIQDARIQDARMLGSIQGVR